MLQTIFPQTVMVFWYLSSEIDVMQPFFLERHNSDGYIRMLETIVKTRFTRVTNGRPYTFQQDSATCHTAAKSIKWLADNFYDFSAADVSPNLPYLNPLDYFVWGHS